MAEGFVEYTFPRLPLGNRSPDDIAEAAEAPKRPLALLLLFANQQAAGRDDEQDHAGRHKKSSGRSHTER